MKSVCTSLARILSPGLTLSCSSQDLALSACRWKQLLLRRQLDKDKDNTGSRQSGASTQPIRGTQSHLWPSACCKGTSSGGEHQLKHQNKDLHEITFFLSLVDLWVYLQFQDVFCLFRWKVQLNSTPLYLPLRFADRWKIILLVFFLASTAKSDQNTVSIANFLCFGVKIYIFEIAKGFWPQPASSLLSILGCFSTQRLGRRPHRWHPFHY